MYLKELIFIQLNPLPVNEGLKRDFSDLVQDTCYRGNTYICWLENVLLQIKIYIFF
jgi:hypothetical protein